MYKFIPKKCVSGGMTNNLLNKQESMSKNNWKKIINEQSVDHGTISGNII